ncbi:hypothetical protein G7K_2688-t1 [Saitoella complicata NRRL Y-17804]|uniref:Uncharacterized protein n=1 Tax=Saitoella complicata (strain BCRC 22490 / CBS 7301 / JCM 7358 / NBRC 10748 / NRRL Y-17804) TaxID=698492 RepID=A0A0E9NGI3_SAICN|nr:hypothetical protein G7K_2688-t1 [Saitoella complicata NRRL Y-17804]
MHDCGVNLGWDRYPVFRVYSAKIDLISWILSSSIACIRYFTLPAALYQVSVPRCCFISMACSSFRFVPAADVSVLLRNDFTRLDFLAGLLDSFENFFVGCAVGVNEDFLSLKADFL